MTLNEMPLDRLEETLFALRKAASYRNPETKQRHFCHQTMYRAAFVRGIKERRDLIRAIKKEQR